MYAGIAKVLDNRAASAAGTILVLFLLALLLGAIVKNAESQIENIAEEFQRMRIQRAQQKKAEEPAPEPSQEQAPSPQPPQQAPPVRQSVSFPDREHERPRDTETELTPRQDQTRIDPRSPVPPPRYPGHRPDRFRPQTPEIPDPGDGGGPDGITPHFPGSHGDGDSWPGGRFGGYGSGGGERHDPGGSGDGVLRVLPTDEVPEDVSDEVMDCLAAWLRNNGVRICDNMRNKLDLVDERDTWLTSVQTFTVQEPDKALVSYELFIALNHASLTLKVLLVEDGSTCSYRVDNRRRARTQEFQTGTAILPTGAHCYSNLILSSANRLSIEAVRANRVFFSWWDSVDKPC